MALYDIVKNKFYIGDWSKIAARKIDDVYAQPSSSFVSKTIEFIKVRLLCTVLFVPSTIVDTLASFTIAATSKLRQLFAAQNNKAQFQKRANKYFNNAVKNLWAVCGFIFAIINPKLVAFYFIPKREKYGHLQSGGHLHSSHPELQYPTQLNALQKLIKDANAQGKKVTIMGAGRSQGQQFMPASNNGVAISMKHFNQVVVNPDKKTVTVGAGATWGDVQVAANKHKLAVKVMQASNVFSIGGSIGTNIHGWNKEGTLATTIKSLTIINAQGNIEHLKPSDELFKHVLGGFGQFGVVVSAEIDLVDNETLVEKGVLIKPSNYFRYFTDSVKQNDNIKMHLYRLSLSPSNMLKEGVAVNYCTTDKTQVKSSEGFELEQVDGTRFERIFINFARRYPWVRSFLWSYEKNRLLKHETKTTTNEIMQPAINAMFNNANSESEWLQEFFIPGENLDSFLGQLSDVLTENKVSLLNATVRYVKQDNITKMGYANKGDRFAVVLCFNQSLKEEEILKTKQWVRKAIDLSLENGGAYYLPYQPFASKEQFSKAYPTSEQVYQEKLAVDPKQTFNSGFASKYLAPAKKEENHYKNILATAKNREQFGKFLDNVLERVDKDKLYGLLDNIVTYSDTPKEIYTELLRRISEVMPSKPSGIRRIFQSLSHIKTDLSEQAVKLMDSKPTDKIDGMIEIGYPGRFIRPLKSKLNISGKMMIVNDVESATDYIQTGFPRPYDTFVPFNDYAPLPKDKCQDNSVDLITCFIGLHHIPDHKMDGFLKSLNRVLRPGGSILLVDHDIKDQTTFDMATMAHSVYNAVMGTSLEEEMNEIRNFKPLKEWIDLLSKHGFKLSKTSEKGMVRNGDPTENTMIRLVKKKVCEPTLAKEVKEIVKPVTSMFEHVKKQSNLHAKKHRAKVFAANDMKKKMASKRPA
jgi:FAD/FMN-containing dehydrogenase/SAM-dependent methyltransferase